MEGLVGILYPEVYQVNHHVDAMLDSLRHRNGKKREVFSFKNLQMGIGGGKLASNEKKSIYAAMDGIITNSIELIQALKKQGITLPGNITTSELIVRSYELWGVNFLKQLSGDFALVIFDQSKEKLILARDQIGKKPLYWFSDHRYFIFASELKSLLSSGIVPQTISKEAIAAYLHFGYIPQDMAPIKDVNKLLPGYYLQINLNQNMSIQSYWSYSSYFEGKTSLRKPLLVESLDHLLDKAFKTRVDKSEFIGFYKTDSFGSIALEHCLKKNTMGQNQLLPYSDPQVPQSYFNSLVQAVWHLDEPQANPTIVSLWNLAALASQKTRVLFSDLGFQETLCTQDYFQQDKEALSPLYRSTDSSITRLKRLLISTLSFIYEPLAFKFLKKQRTHSWQTEYVNRHALFDDKTLRAAFPKLSGLFDPQVFLNKFHHLSRIKNLSSSLLYCEMKTHLVDSSILQMERVAAAHGLEWQTPFLDLHLLEFLANHPIVDASFLKSMELKKPECRTKRPESNLLFIQAIRFEFNEILSLLGKGKIIESGLLSETWLSHQIEKFNHDPNPRTFELLWGILILELWYRLYIVRPINLKSPEASVKEILMEK
jgi:asparagine synthase (glutamine-hydrolysing)